MISRSQIIPRAVHTVVVCIVIPAQVAQSQTAPPVCPTDVSVRWHNCVGTYETALSIYEGTWVDNKKNGEGVYLDSEGKIYVGEFLDDAFNGYGALFASNGALISSGTWNAGVLTQRHSVDYLFPKALRYKLFERDAKDTGKNESTQRESDRPAGVTIVQGCLAKGLNPGTNAFSNCIAGD